MPKAGFLRILSLRFTFLMLGLTAICAFTYFATVFINVPFFWLMPALYITACVMIIIDFHNNKHATLLRFGLRVLLTAIIVFGVFPDMTILSKIVSAIYMLIVLSVFSYAITDKFNNISMLCFAMFIFNFAVAFFMRLSPFMAEHGHMFNILVAISTFAILTFFIIQNIDASRLFGTDVVKIPSTTKRTVIVVLAVLSVLVVLFSLMPWILEALEALFSVIGNLFLRLFSLITARSGPAPEYIPYDPDQATLFDDLEPASDSEPRIVSPIIMQMAFGLFALIMLVLIVFALVKLVLFVIRLFKVGPQRNKESDDVFTETIEVLSPEKKERRLRNLLNRPRYSSLKTEHERIIFIYNEYIRRAKRTGLTRNDMSDTPNEVLDGITQSIAESNFPHPENLAVAFNTVKYSTPDTEITGADELKRHLL